MKLIKKALASLCTLAIAMSAVASLATTASAATPTVYAEVTVNEEAGTASVSVYAKDLPSVVNLEGDDYGVKITSMVSAIDINKVTSEDLSTMSTIKINNWINNHVVLGSTGYTPSWGSDNTMTITGSNLAAGVATTVKTDGPTLLYTIKDFTVPADLLASGFTVDLIDNDRSGQQLVLKDEFCMGEPDGFYADFLACVGYSTLSVEDGKWTPSTPSVVWTPATHVANYTGESDDSIATAYKVTLTGDGVTHDTITWKATHADGTVKGHRTTGLDLGGEGTYSFGIAIGGVQTGAEGITKVEAALGAQGN